MGRESLTDKNWKKLAPKVAREKFPLDSLIKFTLWKDFYGKVEKIGPSGRIYVRPGELKKIESKKKGNKLFYIYDGTEFSPMRFNEEEFLRFMPHIEERGLERQIYLYWRGAIKKVGGAILTNVKFEEGEIVKNINYLDLCPLARKNKLYQITPLVIYPV